MKSGVCVAHRYDIMSSNPFMVAFVLERCYKVSSVYLFFPTMACIAGNSLLFWGHCSRPAFSNSFQTCELKWMLQWIHAKMDGKYCHIQLFGNLLQTWPCFQIRAQFFIGIVSAFIWTINNLCTLCVVTLSLGWVFLLYELVQLVLFCYVLQLVKSCT